MSRDVDVKRHMVRCGSCLYKKDQLGIQADACGPMRCGSCLYKKDQSDYNPVHMVRCDAVLMLFFFVQTSSAGLQTEQCGPMRSNFHWLVAQIDYSRILKRASSNPHFYHLFILPESSLGR